MFPSYGLISPLGGNPDFNEGRATDEIHPDEIPYMSGNKHCFYFLIKKLFLHFRRELPGLKNKKNTLKMFLIFQK